MQCPHCNQEHPDYLRVCPTTNLPLGRVITCPNCGREVRPGARFCAGCGQALPRQTAKLDPSVVKTFNNGAAAPAGPRAESAAQPPAEPPATPATAGSMDAPAPLPSTPPAAQPVNAPHAPEKLLFPTPEAPPTRSSPVGEVPPPLEGAAGWVAIPTSPRSNEPPEDARRPQTLKYAGLGLVGLIALAALFFLWRGLSAAAPAATPTAAALLSSPLPPTLPAATATTPASATAPALAPSPSLPPTRTSPPSPAPTKTAALTETPTLAPALTASPVAPSIITPTVSVLEGSGHGLAFSSNRDGSFKIYLMNPEKPSEWHLVPFPPEYESVAWPSFCGEKLAFEAEDRSLNLPRWIFLFDLSTQAIQPLEIKESPPMRAYSAGCSPSGRHMAAAVMREGRWYLDTIDLEDGLVLAEQPSGGYPQFGFASWPASEDFFIWMGIKDSGYFDVNRTTNPASGPARTNVMAQGRYPAISPDGTKLAFFCGNLSNLCMADWPSVKLLFQIPISYFKLINQKNVPASVAWSVDGQWVYFSSSINGNWDIYRMHPDGSQVQNLTEGSTADEIMPAAR